MRSETLCVGIRREDKNEFEARTPLTPDDVRALASEGVHIVVEPSPQRVFRDAEYEAAGAIVTPDLSSCAVVLGVKEIPNAKLEGGRTYVYFSHTIKGQPHNMPMLRHILDAGCNLIDYECVTDDRGLRLIAFGRQAGQAGMMTRSGHSVSATRPKASTHRYSTSNRRCTTDHSRKPSERCGRRVSASRVKAFRVRSRRSSSPCSATAVCRAALGRSSTYCPCVRRRPTRSRRSSRNAPRPGASSRS
ncbi:MAG: hypothetical protein HC882_07860 [Acidobacteria bacterium]|nr:hypothetical protein [Acidobacteriota bacterium]